MKHFDSESSLVANLTAKQRECLHLVALRKSSREIARILKISRSAVDHRLVSARRVLGASTRDEAALIYAKASGSYDRKTYDPAAAISNISPGIAGCQAGHSNISAVEEVSLSYDAGALVDPDGLPGIPKGAKGDWGAAQRIAIIVVLAIGILAIILIGLSVSQSLSNLFAV